MNSLKPAVTALLALVITSCSDRSTPTADGTAAPWECIAAKVTIGDTSIDTVVRYNKFNGETQLLNAASFASKTTGAQGNIIGWVPLGDLKSAVQELMQREQAAQQNLPAAPTAVAQLVPDAEPSPKNK